MSEQSCEILVAGGSGQLGAALADRRGVVGLPSGKLDVRRIDLIRESIRRYRPRAIVNAAAFTAVDDAELDEEAAEAVNTRGAENLATACCEAGIRLVQISTDFVFDGTISKPIPPDLCGNPISVYGRTKWEGERSCRTILGESVLIVRTAWVYAAGHANFVATMLRLMRSRKEVAVVADQVGTPTWVETLCDGVLRLIAVDARGTYHLTDSGVASWYDFAVAIEEIGWRNGLLERRCGIRPIRTTDYPTPAKRPAYSVLEKSATFEAIGGATPHWRESLERCLENWVDPA